MKSKTPVAAIAAVLVLLVAGCLGDGGSSNTKSPASAADGGVAVGALERLPIDQEWAERALSSEDGHNHQEPKDHQNLSTSNFQLVGYNPLVTDYHGKTTGDYFCGSTEEADGQRLSVVHSFGSDVAMVLADTTDPTDPRKLGELVMGNTQVYDATISPDLSFVLLSTSPMDSGPDLAAEDDLAYGQFMWRDSCTGQETMLDGPESGLPFASGIVLVDITNPMAPQIVDFRPFPVMGGHSVRAQMLDDEVVILVSVPNIPSQASYYAFMKILELPTGMVLDLQSTYYYGQSAGVAGAPAIMPSGGMHDGYVQKHPITQENLAYLAYGGFGIVVLNIDDLRSPRFLAHWMDFDPVGGVPTGGLGVYFHEALPASEAWDGRHYTFVGEECTAHRANTPTCLIFTLDTTDPANPTFVGAWTLPVDVQWTKGLEFSIHYIALQGRTLFATLYHGGLWAIDVSTPESLRMMPSIGAYLPAQESPEPIGKTPRSLVIQQLYGGYALDDTPTVLDVDPTSDGHLVLFDGTSGLYVVKFDASYPAPAPEPWPLPYHEA